MALVNGVNEGKADKKDPRKAPPTLAAKAFSSGYLLSRRPAISIGLDLDDAPQPVVQKTPRHVIRQGDELSGEENFLRSRNGRYEAVFRAEGPLEVYWTDGKPVGDRSVIIHSRRLRSHTGDERPLKWKLNDHGHLVAIYDDGNVYFTTESIVDKESTNVTNCRLEIRDDGNVVLYHGNDAVWKTTTGERSQWSIQSLYTFGSKWPGLGLMKQGSTLYNGDYLAKLENDGRICIYVIEHDITDVWKCEKCVWSSRISAHARTRALVEPYRLLVQQDGDAVVKDGRNVVVWRTRTKGMIKCHPAVFQVTQDGRLELRDGDGRLAWSSNTEMGTND